MNRSDGIYIVNGWVLFGRSDFVPLDAISAVYLDWDEDAVVYELRVERRGLPDADLTVFSGTEQECRNRMGQLHREIVGLRS